MVAFAAASPLLRQGDGATAAMTAGAVAAVGLLPQSSRSGHSRGRSLLSFSNDSQSLLGGGGPFPFYRAQDEPRGERAHLRPTNLIAPHKIG